MTKKYRPHPRQSPESLPEPEEIILCAPEGEFELPVSTLETGVNKNRLVHLLELDELYLWEEDIYLVQQLRDSKNETQRK